MALLLSQLGQTSASARTRAWSTISLIPLSAWRMVAIAWARAIAYFRMVAIAWSRALRLMLCVSLWVGTLMLRRSHRPTGVLGGSLDYSHTHSLTHPLTHSLTRAGRDTTAFI